MIQAPDKKEYLLEDENLLKEMEEIGPMSTGQALAEQERKISLVQFKATLRSRKTMSSLEKSTTRYSMVLIILGMLQFFAVLSQLLFETSTSEHKWIGIGTMLFLGLVVFITFKIFNLDKLNKD